MKYVFLITSNMDGHAVQVVEAPDDINERAIALRELRSVIHRIYSVNPIAIASEPFHYLLKGFVG